MASKEWEEYQQLKSQAPPSGKDMYAEYQSLRGQNGTSSNVGETKKPSWMDLLGREAGSAIGSVVAPESPATKAMQILNQAMRPQQSLPQNIVAGAMGFAPYTIPYAGQVKFATDIVAHPEQVVELAKMVPESYKRIGGAIAGDTERQEQFRQEPIETGLSAIAPLLLVLGIGAGKKKLSTLKTRKIEQNNIAKLREILANTQKQLPPGAEPPKQLPWPEGYGEGFTMREPTLADARVIGGRVRRRAAEVEGRLLPPPETTYGEGFTMKGSRARRIKHARGKEFRPEEAPLDLLEQRFAKTESVAPEYAPGQRHIEPLENAKIQAFAKRNNLKFDGAVDAPKGGKIYSFTDPQNGGTFATKSLPELEGRIKAKRAEFEAGKIAKRPPEEPPLAETPVPKPEPPPVISPAKAEPVPELRTDVLKSETPKELPNTESTINYLRRSSVVGYTDTPTTGWAVHGREGKLWIGKPGGGFKQIEPNQVFFKNPSLAKRYKQTIPPSEVAPPVAKPVEAAGKGFKITTEQANIILPELKKKYAEELQWRKTIDDTKSTPTDRDRITNLQTLGQDIRWIEAGMPSDITNYGGVNSISVQGLRNYPDLAAKYGKGAQKGMPEESSWTSDVKKHSPYSPMKYADKNLIRDEGVEADVNGFFTKLQQPSESTVKKAIIWTSTDEINGIQLSYKSGGGALSDRAYSSSLAIKEDNKWRVIVKKQSNNFNDVRIDDTTIGEARSVLLTPDEISKKRREHIETDIPYASFVASLNPTHISDLITRIKNTGFSPDELVEISNNIKKRVGANQEDLGVRGKRMLEVADAIDAGAPAKIQLGGQMPGLKEAVEGKKAWQLTKQEYLKAEFPGGVSDKGKRASGAVHKQMIKDALFKKQDIPLNVLREYPREVAEYGGEFYYSKYPELKKPIQFRHAGVTPREIIESAKQVGALLRKIETVDRGVKASKFISDNLIKQYRNTVKAERSKAVVADVEKADNIQHRLWGRWLEQLRKAEAHRLSEKEAIEFADKIERGELPDIRKLTDEIFVNAKSVGLKVPGYQKNYFPRMMKEDVATALYDDIMNKMQKHKELKALGFGDDKVLSDIVEKIDRAGEFNDKTSMAIGHLIKTGQAKNGAQAFHLLKQQAYADIFRPFGNLEKSRVLDLPKDFYERDVRKVMPRYISSASRRIAEVKIFGKNGEKLTQSLNDIKNVSPSEAKQVQTMVEMWNGSYEIEHRPPSGFRIASETFTSGEFATKIGLGTAAIPNMTQSLISTFPIAGYTRGFKSLVKILDKSYRSQEIRSSGATIPTAVQAFSGHEPTGVFAKIGKATGAPFNVINKTNQYIAASAADLWVRDLYEIANKSATNPFSRMRQVWAKNWLDKFQIDPSKPLTDKVRHQAMYRFATDTQLQKNVMRDPKMANNPYMRPLYLFKRFGLRQFTMVKDDIIMQTFQKPTGLRGWEKTAFQVGVRAIPTLRLVAGGVIGGEFVIWARNQIQQILSGEPVYRKEDNIWERVINDLAAVGSLGVITDIAGSESTSGALRRAVEPVIISDINRAWDIAKKVEEDQEKYKDWAITIERNWSKVVGFLGSMPRWVSQRMKTPQQKKYSDAYYKGQEKADIIDLILGDEKEKAARRLALWNEHHKDNQIKIKASDIRERKKNKSKY